jgi:hypothetical protein
MKCFNTIIPMLCLTLCAATATAQKPFTEGVLIYNVNLTSPDNEPIKGVYVYSFKDVELKKELKLDNGYVDVMLVNTAKNTVYTLQNHDGQKFAIQLSMEDLLTKQQRYKGYSVSIEENAGKKLAGCVILKGKVTYKDGGQSEVLFTKEWQPTMSVAYNRFPEAQFMPLQFSISEASGMNMLFEANSIEPGPVPSSVFRIPNDYKMISYEEYKQLSR